MPIHIGQNGYHIKWTLFIRVVCDYVIPTSLPMGIETAALQQKLVDPPWHHRHMTQPSAMQPTALTTEQHKQDLTELELQLKDQSWLRVFLVSQLQMCQQRLQ